MWMNEINIELNIEKNWIELNAATVRAPYSQVVKEGLTTDVTFML